MRTVGRNPWIMMVAVVACLLLHSTSGMAEVGVAVDPQNPSTMSSGPWLFTIVDEPDPWGGLASEPTPGRVILNPDGGTNGDGPPSLLYNPVSDIAIVAWARNSASGFDVVVSRFVEGAWSEPTVVAGEASDELDPSLSLDPSDGTVHVFYWVNEQTPKVMHRQAPADLSTWSDAEQVSEEGEPACRPSGLVHEGVLRVAYEVHYAGFGQTPRDVVLARKDGSGFVPEIVATTYFDGQVLPRIQGHSGRMWVDWIDASDEIAWTRLEGPGQWGPIQYEPYETVEERDYLVRDSIRLKAIQEP